MAIARLLLVALLVALGCGPSPGRAVGGVARGDDRSPPSGRLDDRALPRRAALELELRPGTAGFAGRIRYDLQLTREVDALWLHAAGLTIERAELEVDGARRGLSLLPAPADAQRVGFDLGGAAGPGPARLHIAFRGDFGERDGLFVQRTGGRAYAYTDFEATDARRAFPCFDDPRFKHPWQVSLIVDDGDRAFANMPEIARAAHDADRVRVDFAETRPLPSYLVAFAVGPFDVLEGPDEPVPFRVIAPAGEAALGAYALTVAPELLAILERYFASDTPYPKLDLLAVPSFYGAMENPGLITFSRSLLLLDPDRATRREERLLAGVIAHELAHLWFGDLVTMHWWNDLWLNEGFATWMSDKVVAAWAPDEAGHVLDIADKRAARDVDRRGEARAVRQPITDESRIDEAFDAITYRKGGAVLAMIEGWLGEEVVRRAVRDYVRVHADGNARAEDLVAALERASGRPVGPALSSFLEQPGIPVIDLDLRCEATPPQLVLRQRPYGGGDRRWQVPVCWRDAARPGGEARCELLDQPTETVALAACPGQLVPNHQERGYYFYSLEPGVLDRLAAAETLSQRERAGLIENAAALVYESELSPTDLVRLSAAALTSSDPDAVEVAVEELLSLAPALPAAARAAAVATLRERVAPAAVRLGVTPLADESVGDARRRRALLRLLGDLDAASPALADDARAALLAWSDGALPADHELLDAAVRVAAIDAGPAFFDALREAARDAPTPTRSLLLRAPLFSHRAPILERALGRLRDNGLDPFAADALSHAAADPATRAQVDDFLREHGAALETVPAGARPSLLSFLFVHRCDRRSAAEVERQFADETGARVAEHIRRCVALRGRLDVDPR